MRIRGLDFTSSSSSSAKANHLVEGTLRGCVLELTATRCLANASAFREVLSEDGPWVLGLDFPFGLPGEFVEALDWDRAWSSYAAQATGLSYADFRERIETFRGSREKGRKQPKRVVDRIAHSQSPLTTVRTPVAAMFHAGAPYLLAASCDVLPFRSTGKTAVVVEAYPALIAQRLVARNRYKDGDDACTREVRDTLLRRIKRGDPQSVYGFDVRLSHALGQVCLDDNHGDVLDSVFCAIQAAWAYTERDHGWGIPPGFETEGWITDPSLVRRASDGPSWEPIRDNIAPPMPTRGAFNSSATRVQPVIRALLQRDPTGESWLPTLVTRGTRNNNTAPRLASLARARGLESTHDCFERAFPPPASLLRWCIETPDALQRPKRATDKRHTRSSLRLRRNLLGHDDVARRNAQDTARALLKNFGAGASRRAWWAFEGFTTADCSLETPDFLLVIEGKRFEPVSSTVSWIRGRNQISRNLEVISEYARAKNKDFAVLLIGPDGTRPPADTALRAGWPHLSPSAQDDLLDHFLGATTWQTVCDACDITYDSLPITTHEPATRHE